MDNSVALESFLKTLSCATIVIHFVTLGIAFVNFRVIFMTGVSLLSYKLPNNYKFLKIKTENFLKIFAILTM